jgi:hypothetical protein
VKCQVASKVNFAKWAIPETFQIAARHSRRPLFANAAMAVSRVAA